MTKHIFLLAALGLAFSAIGAQSATLRPGAVCTISRDADIVAERVLREGDQKAFQIMVASHQAGFLNGTEIDVLSSIWEGDYLAIRVMGTFHVYYTFYTNVIGSAQLDAELEAIRSATQEAQEFNEDLQKQTRQLNAQSAILEEQLRRNQ